MYSKPTLLSNKCGRKIPNETHTCKNIKNSIELRRFVVLKRWSTLELTLRKINGDTRKYKRIIVLKNLVFLRRVNYKLPLWEARIVEWWYKRVKYCKSLSIGFVIFLVCHHECCYCYNTWKWCWKKVTNQTLLKINAVDT